LEKAVITEPLKKVPDTAKPGSARGTIKGGTFADPKGRVKPPSGDPEGVREAGVPMTAKQKSFAANWHHL
jgi:hypothetical protein